MRIVLALILSLATASAARAQNPVPAPPDVAAPPADATKTASGLATKVLTPSTNKDHPTKDDLVTVDYTGGRPTARCSTARWRAASRRPSAWPASFPGSAKDSS
jgi:hypothetical protein